MSYVPVENSAKKPESQKPVFDSSSKNKPEEVSSALERSKMRMALLKANPKPSGKTEESANGRETSFIWRKPAETEFPSNASVERYGRPRERSKEHLTELEKKYNPVVAETMKKKDAFEQPESMNTFRKGGKRIHNYGFFGDLSH